MQMTFPDQVRNNIHYLLDDFTDLSDLNLAYIDAQRTNLLLAVEIGLRYASTVEATANLMVAVYPLIERRGYVQTWLPYMQNAIDLVVDPLVRLRLQSQLGHLLTLERDLMKAIQVLSATINDPDINQDLLLAARTYFRLGTAYYESGNLSEAEDHARIALAYFQTSQQTFSSPLHLGLVNNLLGQIAINRGQYESGIQYFQEAIHHFQECGDITYLAGAFNNSGICNQELEAYEEAVTCYRKALSLLENTTSELQKCRVHLALGDLYFSRSDFNQAEKAWQAANSPFLQQSGDAYLLGFVYCNLSQIKVIRGELNIALEMLAEAERLWTDSEATLFRGHAIELQAAIYEQMGEIEAALDLYDQAESCMVNYSDNDWAQQRLTTINQRQADLRQILGFRENQGG